MKQLYILLVTIVLTLPAFAQQDTCIDFEGFSLGAVYTHGQTLAEDGISMSIERFVSADGATAYGSGVIVDSMSYQDQALALGNATVEFKFGCATVVTLWFGNNGGNINIEVNGELENVKSVDPSYTIGGVNVTVNHTGNQGSMTFEAGTAAISTLRVGGQEFIIDHVCFLPCDNADCFDFEELGEEPLKPGQTYSEDDKTLSVIPYNKDTSGGVIGGSSNIAGGMGQELLINNAGVEVLYDCASGGGFLYYQNAPGVELTINGETVQSSDMKDFNGLQVSGVQIEVKDGMVRLSGALSSLAISGTELAIDHLCAKACEANCIDFEGESIGSKYYDGDSFSEDGIDLMIIEIESGGLARIEDGQRAGYSGNDIGLFNSMLQVDLECASSVDFHYGQYASGIMIELNGERVSVDSLDLLDGVTVNGVLIDVENSPVSGGATGTVTLTGSLSKLAIGGTELVVDHICHTPCPDPGCVDFEIFQTGSYFGVTDSMQEDLVYIVIEDFDSGSSWAVIGSGGEAAHVGNELQLGNSMARMEFLCASQVMLYYGMPEADGVGLGVNGTLVTTNSFTSLDGTIIDDVAVKVMGTALQGTIQLTGMISSIEIGGTRVTVDHICHEECTPSGDCIDFEELSAGMVYEVDNFDYFMEDDALIFVEALDSPDGFIYGGIVEVATDGMAGHSGQDIWLSNAVLNVSVSCLNNPAFRFGEYSGSVELSINSETQFASSMTDLDGMTIGGVSVSVTSVAAPSGNGVVGLVRLNGIVTYLRIGGSDLYLDHICSDLCPELTIGNIMAIDTEPLNATDRRVVIDVAGVSGPAVLRIQKRDSLMSDYWRSVNTTVIPLPDGADGEYRCEAVVPLTDDIKYFRVRADYD